MGTPSSGARRGGGGGEYLVLLSVVALLAVFLPAQGMDMTAGGTYNDIVLSGVRVDTADYLWVAGYTYNALYGDKAGPGGDTDYFFARYSTVTGEKVMGYQNGTARNDYGVDLAVTSGTTSPAPYIYLVGYTTYQFSTNTNYGGKDYFVGKFDSAGAFYWIQQYGNVGDDIPRRVAMDSAETYLYIVGTTSGNCTMRTYCVGGSGGSAVYNSGGFDAFLAKVSVNGAEQWDRLIGTNETEYVAGVALSGSDVYMAGHTAGLLSGRANAGSSDVFVAKWATDGTYSTDWWYGTSATDTIAAIAADGTTAIYVVGKTYIDTQTADDYTLTRLTTALVKEWTYTGGTDLYDWATDVGFNGANVYVLGNTNGAFGSYDHEAGKSDYFVASHTKSAGTLNSVKQGGTVVQDQSVSMYVKNPDNFYIAGNTLGYLDNRNNAAEKEYWDFFISNSLAKRELTLWDVYEGLWAVVLAAAAFTILTVAACVVCCPLIVATRCCICCWNVCCRKRAAGYGLISA